MESRVEKWRYLWRSGAAGSAHDRTLVLSRLVLSREDVAFAAL